MHGVLVGVGEPGGVVAGVDAGALVAGAVVGALEVVAGRVGVCRAVARAVGLAEDADGDAEPEGDALLWWPGLAPVVLGSRPASSGDGAPEVPPGRTGLTPTPGSAPPPEPPDSAAMENIASAPTTATAPTP